MEWEEKGWEENEREENCWLCILKKVILKELGALFVRMKVWPKLYVRVSMELSFSDRSGPVL